MTFELDWPPEIVARLTEEARQKGLSLDAYLLQALFEKKGGEIGADAEGAVGQRAREEAGRSIRELRKGNVLGPDLSVRDLIEEGRRF